MQSIGVFDSGIGGLSVVKAIKKNLPNEKIIYFGDTVHLPYGDKSVAAIQSYAIHIVDFLLKEHCKMIVIACNSASSVVFDLVGEYVGKRALVVDVINPTVNYVREHFSNKKIGLIGTKQTVNAQVYDKRISKLKKNIQFFSLPTPLLVPMIEEGLVDQEISQKIIKNYLDNEVLKDLEVLILGCTHYPIIKNQILDYYHSIGQQGIKIIDSSTVVSRAIKDTLSLNRLLSKGENKEKDEFYVSDLTLGFEKISKLFFGKEISLRMSDLWKFEK